MGKQITFEALQKQIKVLEKELFLRSKTEKIFQSRLVLIKYSSTHSMEELLQKTVDEVCFLTESLIGFFHFLDSDQQILSLQTWSTNTLQEFCKATGKGFHYKVDQAGVWVDGIRKRKPFIHNDYESLSHKKCLPPGHVKIIRELVVPIIRNGKIVAVIGIGNRPSDYDSKDIETVITFGDLIWDILERKKSEIELQRRQALLQETQNLDTVGSWEWDVTGQTGFWTDEVYKIYGFKPDETQSISKDHIQLSLQCYDPRDRPIILEAFNSCLEEGKPYDLQFPFTKLTGEKIWIRTMAKPIFKDKTIIKVIGNIHDITDQKKYRQELEESRKHFSLFIDSSPDLCFLKDMSGRYLMVNEKNALFFGKEKSDIIGKTDFDLMTINAAEKCRTSDLAAIKEKTIIVSEEKIDDRFYETRKIPIIENNTVVGVAGIIRDISDQKQIENELIESEKKYKHLFENAPSGMYEIDFIKGNFIKVNEIMCKYCGYSEEEFLSMNPLNLLTEDSKNEFLDRFQKIIAGEKISGNIEYYILTKDGQKLCVVLSNDFIYENGKLKGARVVAHNITELKLAEKEKINAQKIAGEQEKLALVGQIAGKMAHDFNNILGIIMGTAELSIMDCQDEVTKTAFELIFGQTLHGKNLTRNLIAFAKNQEPKQENFKIGEKIDLVLNLLKKDLDGIEVIRNDKVDIPALIADPGMIEQALVNLIQNSIHALSKVKTPNLIIRTYSYGNYIYFEIEDNGCGIPKEYFDQIYEPSFTLKGSKDIKGSYGNGIKGTGYGMSNVKKYIEQHNGTISFESEFGSGTKFTISLPVIKKELTLEEKTELQKEILHFGKRILVVEDETAISDIQHFILTQEPCNHIVDVAQTGQAAIDLFEKNEYDIVSLDYILPGKINGMDIYNYIRAQNKMIPILFSSGNIEFLESIRNLKKKDANLDHLSKPFQNKDYIKNINALL